MDHPLSNEKLWKMARKRASFKKHLTTYIVINLFFWALWWFTAESKGISTGPVPWPIWPMLGWGVALTFNYFDAFGPADRQSAIEKEYEKIKAENERKKL